MDTETWAFRDFVLRRDTTRLFLNGEMTHLHLNGLGRIDSSGTAGGAGRLGGQVAEAEALPEKRALGEEIVGDGELGLPTVAKGNEARTGGSLQLLSRETLIASALTRRFITPSSLLSIYH